MQALRELFHYYPKLTREQFLSSGYTERKLILTTDILHLCQAKHRELSSEREEGGTAAGGGKARKRGRSRGRRRRRAHLAQTAAVADSQVSDTVQQVPSVCSTVKDIHLPPSPPPSPRHITPSPAVIHGPEFILPDADLAATPTRTTTSPTSLITSNSHLHDHSNLDQVDIGPILARARKKEGLSAQYIDALAEHLPPLKEHTDKKEAVIRMYMEGGPLEKKGKDPLQRKNSAKSEQELLQPISIL